MNSRNKTIQTTIAAQEGMETIAWGAKGIILIRTLLIPSQMSKLE